MFKTRAVLRQIESGTEATCPGCLTPVRFRATQKNRQVIANIYGRDGNPEVWDRVEQWHSECYERMENPHGEPDCGKIKVERTGFSSNPKTKRKVSVVA